MPVYHYRIVLNGCIKLLFRHAPHSKVSKGTIELVLMLLNHDAVNSSNPVYVRVSFDVLKAWEWLFCSFSNINTA